MDRTQRYEIYRQLRNCSTESNRFVKLQMVKIELSIEKPKKGSYMTTTKNFPFLIMIC